jgi:hypothetical protein
MSRLRHLLVWYTEAMAKKKKQETRQVRVSLQGYEHIRRMAYKQRKTMQEVADELILRKGV